MACTCSKRSRGRWSNGTEAITFVIASKCGKAEEDFPREFGDASNQETCCATYSIRWQARGFQGGDLVILKKFSAGDDSWGPFDAVQIPAGGGAASQTVNCQACKEGGECDEQRVGKLEFEKRVGGAGPVGRTIALGTIADLKICKVKEPE